MKSLKHFCFSFLFLNFCLSSFSIAEQLKRNPEVRFGSVQEYRNREALLKGKSGSSTSTNNPVTKSDLGLQRPVETKNKGFGYHFGFESKLLHSNNPGSSPSAEVDSAGIWENSLSNNFLLGAYDFGGASFSPIMGLGLSNSSYFGDDTLDALDSNNLNLSFVGIFQFSKGWSVRGGLSSSFDFNPDMQQTYRQTSPSIGLSKGFNIAAASAFVDLSFSYHITDTDDPTDPDKMDRFESALLFGVDIPMHNFEISPYLRFCLANYGNQDRDEFTTNAGIDVSYHFYDWLALKFLLSYSNRNANGADGAAADFSRFDFGGAISLNAQF